MSRSELVRRYGILPPVLSLLPLEFLSSPVPGWAPVRCPACPMCAVWIFPALLLVTFNLSLRSCSFGAGRPAGPGIQPGQFLQLPPTLSFLTAWTLWMWVLHFFIPEVPALSGAAAPSC